jgi:hypothetical protein
MAEATVAAMEVATVAAMEVDTEEAMATREQSRLDRFRARLDWIQMA